MISIIVSSYKQNLFKQFSDNVANTVGVEYEIIQINNPGSMGICEAYYLGVQKANFEILCFCHEDILFHTYNWGVILNKLFSDGNIGLVGIAGSQYKTYFPSGWSFSHSSRFMKMNLIQREQEKVHILSVGCIGNNKYEEVATVDGCFMSTTKTLALQNPFDQITFSDFHCYDIDFSLQIGRSKKIVVTYEILIEHLSLGNFSIHWIDETLKLHNKWNNLIPVFTGKDITAKEMRFQEYGAFSDIFSKAVKYNHTKREIFFYIFTSKYRKIVGLNGVIKSLLKSLLIILKNGKP